MSRLAPFRRALVALVALVMTLAAAAAGAKEASKAQLVVVVEGGGGDKLKTALGGSLPEPWARADSKAVAKAAKTRKLPASPAALDKPKTKGPYLTKVGQVTEDVGARGALVVRVTGGGKKKRAARVVLVSPAGSTLVDTTVALDAPANDAALIQKAIAGELGALAPPKEEPPPEKLEKAPEKKEPVAEAAPPPPPPPPPPEADGGAKAGAEAKLDVPPPTEEPKELMPPVLETTLALELASRHITYRDLVTPNLKPYRSGTVPTPMVGLDFYPLARSGTIGLQDIGLTGTFRNAFGQGVDLADGTRVPIVWSRVDAGLKLRVRFARGWHVPQLAIGGGYSQESFLFRDPNPTSKLDTPSVAYRAIRPSLEARLPAGPLAVVVSGAYLAMLGSGELATRVRGTKVKGLEADLSLALPIVRFFEVRAGLAYRRMSFSFAPEAGDTTIVGGATDEIIRGHIDLGLRL